MQKIVLIPLLFFMAILYSCNGEISSDSESLMLDQNWHLQSSEMIEATGKDISSTNFSPGEWYEVDLPSTVLAALVENGVYKDPYYGDNLKSIPGYREGRWLAMKEDSPFYPSWWYRKEFTIPLNYKGKNMVLHLDGINYKANVWLNGQQIADSGQVKGMFRRFEFDINKFSNPGGRNVLALEIISPGHIPDIPYHTKQLEATTGWDDHNPQPPDLNMGIWRSVYITITGAVDLKHPYVSTDLDLPSLAKAHLTISTELTNKTKQKVNGELKCVIENLTFSKKVNLNPFETKVIKLTPAEFSQLIIINPRIWWPHPHGKQELYTLNLVFNVNGQVSDQQDVKFGIREVSTYINDEGWRGYKVNGKNILIRGGAWMTSDMLLRFSKRRYEALVRYAREANLNMLRSEGFSIRETDEFYDICDKYGIMVTQQIFGRNLPDEKLSIENIKDMLLRIRNHPSLVHFLGHDETFPTVTLDSAYRKLMALYTPERTYQPHSGAFDINNRFKTGGTRTGTLELWTYAPAAHYYLHKDDGAWGFAQSGGIGGVVAPYESVRKIMPEKYLWPVNNETFSFHTVLQGIRYFNVLIDAMNTRYGKINGIEDFCLTGQVSNYESARGMYEAYGRNKYDALGITTWKYDAAWPAALTWQYVDWYLNVGGAYYGAKKACEPIHVQYAYDDKSVYIINNYFRDFQSLKVRAKVLDMNMVEVFNEEKTVNIKENGKVKAFAITLPESISKTYFLSLKLEDQTGKIISDNFYWLSTIPDRDGEKGEEAINNQGQTWHIFTAKQKSYADFTALRDLPKVLVQADYKIRDNKDESIATVNVSNPSKIIAFSIHLSLRNKTTNEEVMPVYWDDNYFSLLPGESKEIIARFNPDELNGSQAIVKADGWNIK